MNILSKDNLDKKIIDEILHYANLLTHDGYVYNTLGTIAVRSTHPNNKDIQIAYTKRAGISLRDMSIEDIAVTSIPKSYEKETRSGVLLYGDEPSVGHQLNLEIFRRRNDISSIIHVHPKEVIAYTAAGFETFEYVSSDLPLVLGKPVHLLPSNVNVELDISSVKDFIDDTNSVILSGHGVSVLGRYTSKPEEFHNVTEAYNRLSTLVRDIDAFMKAHNIAKTNGIDVVTLPKEELNWAFENADKIIYPKGR